MTTTAVLCPRWSPLHKAHSEAPKNKAPWHQGKSLSRLLCKTRQHRLCCTCCTGYSARGLRCDAVLCHGQPRCCLTCCTAQPCASCGSKVRCAVLSRASVLRCAVMYAALCAPRSNAAWPCRMVQQIRRPEQLQRVSTLYFALCAASTCTHTSHTPGVALHTPRCRLRSTAVQAGCDSCQQAPSSREEHSACSQAAPRSSRQQQRPPTATRNSNPGHTSLAAGDPGKERAP